MGERQPLQQERRSFLKNPYVLAFLVGIATLTALRPLLRYIPEPPPVLSTLPGFALSGTDGRPYGSDDLRGVVWIAGVFESRCSSTCAVAMAGMHRLQDAFARMDIQGIKLVSITADPARDTPEVLAAYANARGIDPQRWTLLTGDPERVSAVVVSGLKIPLALQGPVAPTPVDAAHAGRLVLIDGRGRIRGYYGTDETGLDEVYNRAQHVLREQREASRSR